jgi:D-tyrosyl-tRNA(Tyr) deacylase
MRIVVQRVLQAAVRVGGQEVSKTGRGLLILLGITQGDNPETITRYAQKMLKLRIWDEIPNNKDKSTKKEEDTPTSTTSTSST